MNENTKPLDPEAYIAANGHFRADIGGAGLIFAPRDEYEQDESRYPITTPTASEQYEWMVTTIAGQFEHGTDEESAREAADRTEGGLYRRPVAEWVLVQDYYVEDDETDD